MNANGADARAGGPCIGAIGDIHGDFDSARRIMERHLEVPFWLCVGDVADERGEYEPLPSPLYWIKGNNENFDTIASGEFPENLHHIPNGQLTEIDGLRIAGLGGTHAPTMYEMRAADLPHGGGAPRALRNDRRRHFVREEVERCKAAERIDIFLSHEAPRPFRSARGNDAGKTPINEVLSAVKPRLHLFGHHHRFAESAVQGVRSICLDLVGTSYLLIDRKTLECQQFTT